MRPVFYNKMRQKFITKYVRFLLQNATVLLENATVIALLQNATVIAKCDFYYKLRQYSYYKLSVSQ